VENKLSFEALDVQAFVEVDFQLVYLFIDVLIDGNQFKKNSLASDINKHVSLVIISENTFKNGDNLSMICCAS